MTTFAELGLDPRIVLDVADQAPGATRKNHTPKPRPTRRPAATPTVKKHFSREDWMQYLNPDMAPLKGEKPDFTEEGWARRKPRK